MTVILLLVTSCIAPGRVRPMVKIGLVAPFEGRYRYVGYDVIYAARLALQEANEGGGVAGYGVELVAYDDGADPTEAIAQARKLDVDPDVLGAIGHFHESSTAAALSTYVDAGLPLLVPVDLSIEAGERRTIHVLGPSPNQLALPLLDRANRLAGGEAIVVVGEGGPLTAALVEAGQRRGLRIRAVSASESDCERKVMAYAPEVMLVDMSPVAAGELVSGLRERGWEGVVLGGPTLAMADFVAVANGFAAGSMFLTPWPFPRDISNGDAFASAYGEVSNGTVPGPFALPAYEATWVLLKALDRAAADGIPTRDRVSAALLDLEQEGLPSRLGLDGGILSSDGALFWYRIGADGTPKLIDRGSYSTAGASKDGVATTAIKGQR